MSKENIKKVMSQFDPLSRDLIEDACEKAMKVTGEKGAQHKMMVWNGILRRFGPYVDEGVKSARKFGSDEYSEFKDGMREFLGVDGVGVVLCSDGRVLPMSVVDYGVAKISKRPGGIPETRRSTGPEGKRVLCDPEIKGHLAYTIEKSLREKGKEPVMVQFIGPHFNSENPVHGCGAAKIEATSRGRPAVTAMRLGAVSDFFERFDGHDAFDNTIKRHGGLNKTFSMAHDIKDQSLTFGLKEVYDRAKSEGRNMFDEYKTLPENLVELNMKGNILMTSGLDKKFVGDIDKFARARGLEKFLQIRNPDFIDSNIIHIGSIARQLTEKAGLDWMPGHLIEGLSDEQVRVFAYHALRNVVYRKLGNIKPNNHDLIDHPEELIRVGPIGAAHNVRTIPFIESTSGTLNSKDVEGVKALYGLSGDIYPNNGIDLRYEGRVIVVTGKYSGARHLDERREIWGVESETRTNVACLRREFDEGVRNGETIIMGVIYDEKTKLPIKVV